MSKQSQRGSSESSWLAARRCLALVNRLQQGPATKQELLEAIYRPEDAAASQSALSKRFENDKVRLWDNLKVRILYDKVVGGYVMTAWERPLLNEPAQYSGEIYVYK